MIPAVSKFILFAPMTLGLSVERPVGHGDTNDSIVRGLRVLVAYPDPKKYSVWIMRIWTCGSLDMSSFVF